MINADKFEQVFGIYATELWAKPEKEFLEWLNSEAQEVKDTSITSAERTEIVRCKDCKRYDGKPCGLVNFYNTDNDYCSRYEGKG